MRRSIVFAVAVSVVFPTAGCQSSLEVEPYLATRSSEKHSESVPVFLPEHEFVVTKLALNESGSEVEQPEYQVSLVARPDRKRSFLVRNRPALLSQSSFTVMFDQQGTLEQVSGDVTDKTLETTQALISLIPAAALLARALETQHAEDEELKKHMKAKERLLELLARAEEPDQIKTIQDALKLTLERIAERQAALAAKSKAPKGVKPFGEAVDVPVYAVANEGGRERKVQEIKDGYQKNASKVYVILVPVDEASTP